MNVYHAASNHPRGQLVNVYARGLQLLHWMYGDYLTSGDPQLRQNARLIARILGAGYERRAEARPTGGLW
jgi:hypothetical protein